MTTWWRFRRMTPTTDNPEIEWRDLPIGVLSLALLLVFVALVLFVGATFLRVVLKFLVWAWS